LRIVRQLLKKKVRGRLQRRLRRIRQLLRSMRRPGKAVGAAIRNNHMTPTIAAGARLSRWFLYYYWNEQNWTMHSNGEMLLLRTLAAHWSSSPSITVFDVGANKGSYTKLVRKTMPNSVVHCFEIIPRTRDSLTANLSGIEDVVISDYGLSNAETHLEVGFNYDDDSRARVTSTLLKMNEVIACKVQTGDQYLAERNIEAVDLLKIDTEGHEIAVLEGFRSALQEAKSESFSLSTELRGLLRGTFCTRHTPSLSRPDSILAVCTQMVCSSSPTTGCGMTIFVWVTMLPCTEHVCH
jgi:FkbM family methyltransferase